MGDGIRVQDDARLLSDISSTGVAGDRTGQGLVFGRGGPGLAERGDVVVLYESHADEDLLEYAIEFASQTRAKVSVIVPIRKANSMVCFAGIDPSRLQYELDDHANLLAAEAVAKVPRDIAASGYCWRSRLPAAVAAAIEDRAVSLFAVRTQPWRRVLRWTRRAQLARRAEACRCRVFSGPIARPSPETGDLDIELYPFT